jgi:hypothetical protein
LGVARGLVDASSKFDWGDVDVPKKMILVFGVVYGFMYFPLVASPHGVQPFAWAAWGAGLAMALTGALPILVPDLWKGIRPLIVMARAVVAWCQLSIFIVAFINAGKTDATSDMTFARNLALPLPPLANWLTLVDSPVAVAFVAVVDVLVGIVVMALNLVLAAQASIGEASEKPRFAAAPLL